MYLRAVPVSLMSKTGVGGFSGDPQKLPNVNTFIDGYISTPSYLRYIYTSENYLKRNIPSEIYPVIYPSSVDSIYYGGGKVSEGHSQAMDAEKTHNKSYFSDYYHIPQHQHLTNSRYSGGELPIRYYVTSQPVDKKKESRYVRPTHHKAIHSGLTFSSASLSGPSPSRSWDSPFQVPSSITQSSHTAPISSVNENNFHNTPAQRTLFGELDTMNRDEIMYYTGLQKEIEKSDVLLDAIKNVRTREGKMMKDFRNSELTTTTVTPVPDIKAVRNKFGSHPLYDKLPRESTRIIHKEEYEDEKDEYENMYLPVRFKSLELKEIHEVKKNFSSLVPKDAYKSRPLVMHPTHQPPITTYKPPFVPKYNKNRKPMTSPPSKFQFMSTLPSHGKNYSKVKTVNSFHRTSGRVWPSHTNSHRQPAAVYLLGNYNIQKPESLRAYGPSSSQKQRPLKLNNLSSQRLRSHNTHSSGYQSQPLPKHPIRRFPISQRTADHTNPSSRKRGHSRHPTSSLFEDAKILLRPELEKKEKEEMTQKRRPDMEASLFDADVTFPKFGFNIDSYFNRFPKFGFFDYEP
ncbi:hypothetical protein OTU49_002164 [Cherax quadricarinatus]|uniref:Uncharacterized protein n=1 Tax=Cherax quadricarinatus TaxID=27406 RepID=A0AAW0XQV5_CHEQU